MPDKTRAPESFGSIDRDRLSGFFVDFIDAQKDVVRQIGKIRHFVPSVLFVYSEHGRDDFLVFSPYNVRDMFNRAGGGIDGMFSDMAHALSPERFTLELIMYVHEVEDTIHLHPRPMVMFGARDLGGTTVHSVYALHTDPSSNARSLRTIDDAPGKEWLHVWLPRNSGYMMKSKDDFLNMLSVKYGMAVSARQLASLGTAPSTEQT